MTANESLAVIKHAINALYAWHKSYATSGSLGWILVEENARRKSIQRHHIGNSTSISAVLTLLNNFPTLILMCFLTSININFTLTLHCSVTLLDAFLCSLGNCALVHLMLYYLGRSIRIDQTHLASSCQPSHSATVNTSNAAVVSTVAMECTRRDSRRCGPHKQSVRVVELRLCKSRRT